MVWREKYLNWKSMSKETIETISLNRHHQVGVGTVFNVIRLHQSLNNKPVLSFKGKSGMQYTLVSLLAVIRRGKLDKIIMGFRASCQDQKHWGGKTVLLVIIVGTIVLKACTSITVFIKVAPMWFTKQFYNYWILLSFVFLLFLCVQTHSVSDAAPLLSTEHHLKHLEWKWAFRDFICILAHSQVLQTDINNTERAKLLFCWTDTVRDTKHFPCSITQAGEIGFIPFLSFWEDKKHNMQVWKTKLVISNQPALSCSHVRKAGCRDEGEDLALLDFQQACRMLSE